MKLFKRIPIPLFLPDLDIPSTESKSAKELFEDVMMEKADQDLKANMIALKEHSVRKKSTEANPLF
jgi:hypothetical protein